MRFPPALFLVSLGVIGGCLLLGLLWSADPVYGREKTLKFFTVTLLAALSPFVLLTREKDLRRFLFTIAGAGIVVAVLTPLLPPTVAAGIATEYDTKGRFSFGGQIFPARFLCTAALILFVIPGLTSSRWRWLAPVAAIGVAYVAFGFGARGPVAAFIVTLAAVALIAALRSPRVLAGVLCAVVVGAVVLPFVTVPTSAGQRIRQAANDPVTTLRGDTRWILYEQAIAMGNAHPLRGAGTGSFASYVAIVSPPRQRLMYPHNIFLELWSENGILPVLFFLVAVVGATWALMKRLMTADEPRVRLLQVLVLGLLIYNVLVTQVSGDLNDNRTASARRRARVARQHLPRRGARRHGRMTAGLIYHDIAPADDPDSAGFPGRLAARYKQRARGLRAPSRRDRAHRPRRRPGRRRRAGRARPSTTAAHRPPRSRSGSSAAAGAGTSSRRPRGSAPPGSRARRSSARSSPPATTWAATRTAIRPTWAAFRPPRSPTSGARAATCWPRSWAARRAPPGCPAASSRPP